MKYVVRCRMKTTIQVSYKNEPRSIIEVLGMRSKLELKK